MRLNTVSETSSPLVEQFDQRKFTRRDDLTTPIRMEIAIQALHAGLSNTWGAVTDIAKRNNVSRTFVYSLCNTLKDAGQFLFEESTTLTSCLSPRERLSEAILSFRLEGRSSLNAISTMLDRWGFPCSSVGFISQTLSRIGALLPMTISTINGTRQHLIFANDEIFSKSKPILITVDPYSSAIIRIELSHSRKTEDWQKHFEEINANGFHALSSVSDDAQGIRAAHKAVMGDTIRQSDTYHAIAHRLGKWVSTLEETAYKAIRIEQACKKKLNSEKHGSKEELLKEYQLANEIANREIALYDDFYFFYLYLIGELNIFDCYGELRDRQQVEDEITLVLSLLEALKHPKITIAVKQIERALPDLLHYFDSAKAIVYECQKLQIDDACLKEIFLAWQWNKNVVNAKKSNRKNLARKQQQKHLKNAEDLCSQELKDIQVEIYFKLDKIVQSSAMVECINSILRPHLNASKNQITQEQLNLFMFYHNHRRYRAGKREGKTPMELLTGKKQTEDWISLILNILREKYPELLLAA